MLTSSGRDDWLRKPVDVQRDCWPTACGLPSDVSARSPPAVRSGCNRMPWELHSGVRRKMPLVGPILMCIRIRKARFCMSLRYAAHQLKCTTRKKKWCYMHLEVRCTYKPIQTEVCMSMHSTWDGVELNKCVSPIKILTPLEWPHLQFYCVGISTGYSMLRAGKTARVLVVYVGKE